MGSRLGGKQTVDQTDGTAYGQTEDDGKLGRVPRFEEFPHNDGHHRNSRANGQIDTA